MDFSSLMKNFGDMRGKMEEIRKRVSRLQITGEAGAGMVKVTVNGDGVVQDVAIDRTMFTKPEDNGMLEELVMSATNDALKKAREAVAHEMRSITGGLNLPGLDKLFGGMGGMGGGPG